MKDRWHEVWQRQAETQKFFNLDPTAMDNIGKTRTAKDLLLGLYEEATELAQDATRYKAHILKARPIERINVADAAADVIKYAISLAQLHGVTADEAYEAFMRKSAVVEDRARGQRTELEVGTKLVVCDLDNVICDMREWQLQLNEARGGAPMNDRTIKLLESLKEDFYRGGGFAKMDPIPGAQDGMKAIKDMGYTIVIITARPQWQYKRLYADTMEWLNSHEIAYDNIIFNKDKAEAIYEHIYPARPSFFVEDRGKHCMEVAGIGVPVLLMDYEYNRDIEETKLITRVENWQEIVEVAKLARPNSSQTNCIP